MSNTLFRKGLVAAALAGLATTAIAGTPAFAASLTLDPAAGTTYQTVVSSGFSLDTISDATFGGNGLSYVVTKPAGVALTAKFGAAATAAAATPLAANVSYFKASDGTSLNTAGVTAATSVVVAVQQYVTLTHTDGASSSAHNVLNVAVDGTSAKDVSVQAFNDSVIANHIVDSLELVSTVRTVNFLAASAVAQTVTVDPIAANGTAKAHVVLSGINQANTDASVVSALFSINGTDDLADTTATYISTTGTFDIARSGAIAPSANVKVTAKLANNDGAGGVVKATAVYATVGAASTATGSSVKSLASSANTVVTGSASPYATSVRGGYTSALTYSVKFVKTSTTSATAPAVAAQPVLVTATPSVSNTGTITVGGKTTTAGSATAISYYTTTDANGLVPVSVSSSNGHNLDTIAVVVSPVGGTAPAQEVDFTWNTAVPTTLVETSKPLAGNTARAVVAGGSFSLAWTLADQFGQAYSDADYTYRVNTVQTETTAANTVNSTAAITAGKASATFVVSSASTAEQVAATVSKAAVGSTTWSAVSVASVTSNVAVADASTPAAFSALTAKNNGGTDLSSSVTAPQSGVTLAAIDNRVDTSVAGLGVVSPNFAVVAGTVNQSNNSVAGYSTVTLAAKGLYFSTSAAGTGVVTADSITVTTGSNGQFTVYAFSNVGGKFTVTATSGAATKTVDAYFASAAYSTGSALTVSAPATALPGTSVVASAVLVDAAGNPVKIDSSVTAQADKFKLSVSGLGSATAVASTDASGKATIIVTFASNESGTATVTAQYLPVADDTTANTDLSTTANTSDIITATAKIVVAVPVASTLTAVAGAAQAQTSSAVSVTVTAKDAAGAAVKGAVITFTATGAAYLSSATATTDANGVATVKLIGNVAGANSVVASANGTSAAAVNVAFGNSDASLSAAGKRVTAAWSFAAGKKVVISVNGVRVKSVVASSDAADSFSFNAKKGTNKVTVSVAGVVTDALTVKVKK